MEPLDWYLELAKTQSKASFAQRCEHHVLLKKPSSSGADIGPITFQTQTISTDESGLIVDGGGFAKSYWLWPLRKKAGNPFAERISLGRAPNCDVVFRLSYISKLHAHVLVEGDKLRIVDVGSANGVEVEGKVLTPNVEAKIHSGDYVKLGALELQLLSAGEFYDWLRAKV